MTAYYPDPDYPFLSISIIDGVYALMYIIVITFLFAFFAKKAAIYDMARRYFMPGLFVKLFSALAFSLIYLFHYGGDTLAYFHDTQVLKNLFYKNPFQYFEILMNGNKSSYFYYFGSETGYPSFIWRDHSSFFVSRLLSPITIIFGNSFLVNTLVVSTISYFGVWKLFLMFHNKYPHLTKQMAIAVLFLPSLVFWGSGIMKDTIIVFSMAMTLVAINNVIQFRFNIKNLIVLILSTLLIVSVKPYVFIALMPGVLIWVGYHPLSKIRSKLLKFTLIPFISIVTLGGIIIAFSLFSESLGRYGSYDSMIVKAQVTQQDLIRAEQYGSNFFYIGEITGTPANLVALFPKAIMAGLFRPYLWEVRNVFMLMSGLENFLLLLLVISVFFRKKAGRVFKLIGNDPFLFGMFIFVIFLAFGVGLSTANFGALVRYRIPLLPVFVAAMFIARDYVKTNLSQGVKKTPQNE